MNWNWTEHFTQPLTALSTEGTGLRKTEGVGRRRKRREIKRKGV